MGARHALFYGIFHSVSAFNNAGFSLAPGFSSFSVYARDIVINLVMTTLVIVGGIGFAVLTDLVSRKRLSLNSKLVLSTTAVLIAAGTICFFFIEYFNPGTIGGLSIKDKLLISYFQAVMPRTGGFHAVTVSAMYPATLIITMFLMFVGASPGGTGGGIKTTTLAVIASTIRATMKGFKDTVIFRRRVPHETVRRAFTITTLATMIVVLAVILMNYFSSLNLMQSAFEVFSAFSNVGLSMGITPMLPAAGKILLIVVMFLGRVGPLTLALSLLLQQKEPRVEYPKEPVSIG